MSQLERIDLNNHLIRLSDEQMLQPFTVLEDFCSAFSPGELRAILAEMTETCVTQEEDRFQKAEKRADILHVAKNIEMVIEAVFLINSLRQSEIDNPVLPSGN